MDPHRTVALAVAAVGCAGELDVARSTRAPRPEAALACDLPPGLRLLPSGSIVADDIVIGTRDEFAASCEAGLPFPAPGAGRRGVGFGSAVDLWPDRVVPYAIDDDLPEHLRVDLAIVDWEETTSLVFVPRTTEEDYVFFTNGNTCVSALGYQSGRQDIELSTEKSAAQIVGTGISVAGDVYTWYDDGMVSAGTSTALDVTRAQYPYALPAGYVADDIVAIAIASDGDVYTWFADGRRSIGTSSDLGAQSGPVTYTLPSGRTAADIVEIDIAVDGDVYTWFDDSKVSIGTSTNLAAVAGPVTFTKPPGYLATDIVGIAIANDGDVYTWFDDREVAIGTSVQLSAEADPVAFVPPGQCDAPSVVHEIGHAVGLFHEQSHPDRDAHVTVFYGNIDPDYVDQFCVAGDDCVWDGGWVVTTAYDVTSTMHYGSYDFSIDDTPTILEKATPGLAVSADDVIDLSISPAGDVYTWWTDGFVTSGSSEALELHRSRYPFALPAGYTAADIVGIAIAKGSGDTYTFYDDQTRSIGSTSDLASISGPAPYLLPVGYTVFDILAIDHAPNGRMYTWWDNGRVSSGTSTDLAAHSSPTLFWPASGRIASQVLGIAISASGTTYAWYTPGDASAGSTTDLDSVRALYDFASLGHEIERSDWLTPGDIAQVEAMYAP